MIRVTRVVTAFFLTLVFAIATVSVSASDTQYGPYGPSPVQSIEVNKTVQRPEKSDFVDNLSPSDPRFAPTQDVFFRITVKNPTDQNLNDVTVKDFIPDLVDVVEHPGSYDSANRVITIDAGDFEPHQEKTYTVKARVRGQDQLPSDRGIFCLINRAHAFNSAVSDEDTAQFCAEKQVRKDIPQVPAAGPEMGLGLLLLNALGFSTGVILRKKR